jgi:hypothetical protein
MEFNSYLEEREILQEAGMVKNAVRSVDKSATMIKSAVSKLHSTSDKNLVDNTPELSKLITRAIIVRASFVVNPVVGLLTLFTTIALKNHSDNKNREKLIDMYSAKLEFVEGKIDREEKDDEKLNLIKMRNALRTDLEKLKRAQDKLNSH